MVRRGHRARGFTLLELMVAAVVALIIMAGAIALLIQGSKLQRRQTELGAMNRDAERVMSQMSMEVRQAGLGRPRGARFVTSTSGAELFPPIVLNATPTAFTFIADLPRPNSNFNGISYLADDQPTAAAPARLAILNELNGDCDVYSADLAITLPPPLPALGVTLNKCATNTRSTLFPGTTVNCSDATPASTIAPSCPWSLNKYQRGEYIILTDTTGKWVELQLSPTGLAGVTGNPPVDVSGSRKTLALSATSTLPAAMVDGTPNRAVLSTPDRVFYRLVPEASGPLFQLERKQCWGQLSVAGTVNFTNVRNACPDNAPAQGTAWELVLGGLPADGVQFLYWDGNGNNLAGLMTQPDPVLLERNLRRVRRVSIRLHLRRPVPASDTLDHTALTSINVRN